MSANSRAPSATAIMTVLASQARTGKSYSLDDGKLRKTSVATAKGRAIGVRVNSAQDHAALLNEVTGDPSAVPIPRSLHRQRRRAALRYRLRQRTRGAAGQAAKDQRRGVPTLNDGQTARKKLRIGHNTWNHIQYEIAHVRIGQRRYFTDEALAAYVARCTHEPPGQGPRPRRAAARRVTS